MSDSIISEKLAAILEEFLGARDEVVGMEPPTDEPSPEYLEAATRYSRARESLYSHLATLEDGSRKFGEMQEAVIRANSTAPKAVEARERVIYDYLPDHMIRWLSTGEDDTVSSYVHELMKIWREDTSEVSSGHQIRRHPALERITALGQKAARQVFRELDAREDVQVLMALHALFQPHGPVILAEHSGRIHDIAVSWRRWAVAQQREIDQSR